ncbi:MAG TPA: DegT/DnrJ/EryC1/StrS family aminotransferase [Armatimonadetes bacterium]|nr:DegT/DnrJ/EryC1/StrS family aminotransferase [Armatimonadota bacterium]
MSEKLALEGGTPVNAEPFPAWPQFAPETIEAAVEPLRTGKVNYWTGELGMQFEQKFAEWCGAKFGISTTSGTSALHVGLAGLEIGPGDEVIVPSYTFIASSFAVCQAGAIPVFADVERETHTLSPESVEAMISDRTRAIMPVHLYGIVCNMGPLEEIARKYNLYIIEDGAQAHGGTYRGKKVGTIGDVGCFSFCQSKIITTGGEGGAVVTDDEEVAWRCRSFRDHGYDVSERLRLLELEARLPYIHNMVGYNYRMTEVQSAVGLKELERIDTYHLKNRRRNGELLTQLLKDCQEILYLPLDTEERRNAYWMYPIVLDLDKLTIDDARQFVKALEAEGIPCGPVMWPQCYKERAYREQRGFGRLNYPFGDPNARAAALNFEKYCCENAAWLETRTFFVPTHPVYEEKHCHLMAEAIKKVIRAYAR